MRTTSIRSLFLFLDCFSVKISTNLSRVAKIAKANEKDRIVLNDLNSFVFFGLSSFVSHALSIYASWQISFVYAWSQGRLSTGGGCYTVARLNGLNGSNKSTMYNFTASQTIFPTVLRKQAHVTRLQIILHFYKVSWKVKLFFPG